MNQQCTGIGGHSEQGDQSCPATGAKHPEASGLVWAGSGPGLGRVWAGSHPLATEVRISGSFEAPGKPQAGTASLSSLRRPWDASGKAVREDLLLRAGPHGALGAGPTPPPRAFLAAGICSPGNSALVLGNRPGPRSSVLSDALIGWYSYPRDMFRP